MADQQPLGVVTAPEINEIRHRTALFVHGPVFTIRDRVFHALFYRLALIYSRSVPRSLQRVVEFAVLFEALAALVTMTYVHFAFTRNPVNCLEHVHTSWPRDGVLRVEIINNLPTNYTLVDSYRKEFADFDAVMLDDKTTSDDETNANNNSVDSGHPVSTPNTSYWSLFQFWLQETLFLIDKHAEIAQSADTHIFEFASEFGFLRMSPRTRHRLNITTMLVVLDPVHNRCFGNAFSRFLLDEFLGYDDVLLYSMKQLADDRPEKGYCRNVISGDHYKFVDMSVSRLCYLPAVFLMILFTMSISMLLRYSHHQIFIFIVDVLQVFDRTILVTFPLAPLLTAVLALIGVEALISELFTEASTGFYVILIVWLADQYDVICCHTVTSRRHWLRFFYLYHFIFYAYHYRFNGHFSSIALATSWLFIQHSMIYFFHHYELPAVEQQAQVHNLITLAQQQQLPHHLVTVMTRNIDGEITRTTADITTVSGQIIGDAPVNTTQHPSRSSDTAAEATSPVSSHCDDQSAANGQTSEMDNTDVMYSQSDDNSSTSQPS